MLQSTHARHCWRACEAPLSGGLRAGSWLCVALFLIVHPNSGAADSEPFVAVLANPAAFHDKPVANRTGGEGEGERGGDGAWDLGVGGSEPPCP